MSHPIPLMMTSSNGNIFHATGLLWGEFPGHRGIPLTKANDAQLWCFLLSTPERTVEQKMETPVIWDAITLIMTSLQCFIAETIKSAARKCHFTYRNDQQLCPKNSKFIHHIYIYIYMYMYIFSMYLIICLVQICPQCCFSVLFSLIALWYQVNLHIKGSGLVVYGWLNFPVLTEAEVCMRNQDKLS